MSLDTPSLGNQDAFEAALAATASADSTPASSDVIVCLLYTSPSPRD